MRRYSQFVNPPVRWTLNDALVFVYIDMSSIIECTLISERKIEKKQEKEETLLLPL